MSVYTTIEEDELKQFLSNYEVGELESFQGISDGVENTNYFVNTHKGRFVLTIFEHHNFDEMQYYLKLMHHLSDHKVPSANPVADQQGNYLGTFKNKPIALVERINGGSITHTTVDHCQQLGAAMGKMHAAGLSYSAHQENPRGPAWCQQAAASVMEKLPASEKAMLDVEVHFQKDKRDIDLPRGVIHADLFRDNALWHDSTGRDQFSGIIDFYYSCDDVLLYDLAVAANDWCNKTQPNHAGSDTTSSDTTSSNTTSSDTASSDSTCLDQQKVHALLTHYHSHRPLTAHEQEYWPIMLRAGALRFWLSRLQDKHFPRPGELVHTKNPDEFKAILIDRIANSKRYLDYWI